MKTTFSTVLHMDPGTMDCLWFHHTVLLSESFPLLSCKSLKTIQTNLEHISSISVPALPEEESLTFPLEEEGISSDSCPTKLEDESNKEEETLIIQNDGLEISKLSSSNSFSHFFASSQSFPKYCKNSGNSIEMRRLLKSTSCKRLEELELEELKGFLDMGFIFEEEHLTPRMMSVVPGLQRLKLNKNKKSKKIDCIKAAKNDTSLEDDTTRGVARPYLSEAWLVKRANSLNLRVPKLSAPADMKKHIRVWAKSVASAVHKES